MFQQFSENELTPFSWMDDFSHVFLYKINVSVCFILAICGCADAAKVKDILVFVDYVSFTQEGHYETCKADNTEHLD
jgi:hypothetical protein